MLVRRVDELGHCHRLVGDLLLEKQFPTSYAPIQVPSILKPCIRMPSRASILHFVGRWNCLLYIPMCPRSHESVFGLATCGVRSGLWCERGVVVRDASHVCLVYEALRYYEGFRGLGVHSVSVLSTMLSGGIKSPCASSPARGTGLAVRGRISRLSGL
jgi:hypothetical protein